MMEYENIKVLNKSYNKLYLSAIYQLLKNKDTVEKGNITDPVWRENVKILRSKEFISLWSLYFVHLYPILKNLKKIERIELIHTIFGNSIEATKDLWFHWPSLLLVAKNSVEAQLKKHEDFIKNNNKYEFK